VQIEAFSSIISQSFLNRPNSTYEEITTTNIFYAIKDLSLKCKTQSIEFTNSIQNKIVGSRQKKNIITKKKESTKSFEIHIQPSLVFFLANWAFTIYILQLEGVLQKDLHVRLCDNLF